MKKSLLNIAITMAISTTLLSGSVLSTQAYAAEPDTAILTNENEHNDTEQKNYLYSGMGVGAVAGTAIAGPVGLLIGGLVGAFAGASQTVDNETSTHSEIDAPLPAPEHTETIGPVLSASNSSTEKHDNILQLAQLGSITAVTDEDNDLQQDRLLNILTADFSFDVYFRTGSADIESFYPSRLVAIAGLLSSMDTLEIHLDGYTDRRGDKSQNMALAGQRIEKVRQQLIAAGINEHRIISNAFGEMKMVSAAGDLDAYTFDRKVVIRFQRRASSSIYSMTEALSATAMDTAEAETETTADSSVSPLATDTDAVAQF